MKGCTLCVVALLSVLQIGTAVAVIAITAMQLANVTALRDLLNQKVCLASANPTNLGVCTYIYAVGGVSLVFTIAIGLLQLVTCNMCGCGKWMDAVFTLLATGWWLLAGFLTAGHARAANAAGVRQTEWRNAVVLLCWATSGLFGLLFVVHSGRICMSCCRKKRRPGSEADLEKAEQRQRDRPPSAAVELGRDVASRPYMLGRGGRKQEAAGPGAHLTGPNI